MSESAKQPVKIADFSGLRESDEFAEVAAAETVSHAGNEMTVEAIAADLAASRQELEQYRKGALTLAADLQDAIAEAEADGDHRLAWMLGELRAEAMDVYQRVDGQRSGRT